MLRSARIRMVINDTTRRIEWETAIYRKGMRTRSQTPPQDPTATHADRRIDGKTYHVLPPLHEFLVDDFASIVLAGFDMNRLLHDCIRAAPEGTSCAVLEFTSQAERIVSAVRFV